MKDTMVFKHKILVIKSAMIHHHVIYTKIIGCMFSYHVYGAYITMFFPQNLPRVWFQTKNSLGKSCRDVCAQVTMSAMSILTCYFRGNYWGYGINNYFFSWSKLPRCFCVSYHAEVCMLPCYLGRSYRGMFSTTFSPGSKSKHDICMWIINSTVHTLAFYLRVSYQKCS